MLQETTLNIDTEARTLGPLSNSFLISSFYLEYATSPDDTRDDYSRPWHQRRYKCVEDVGSYLEGLVWRSSWSGNTAGDSSFQLCFLVY